MSVPSHLGIIALPFEATTSFLRGTAHGPMAIIHELEQMDGFDFSLARDPFANVPRTIIQPHGDDVTDARLQQAMAGQVVTEILTSGGFPLCLGGEHTISIGPIRSAAKGGELGVVQLDGHADLRDKYEGNKFSHACVMRRVLEMGIPSLGVGIKTMCLEESELIKEHNLLQVNGKRAAFEKDWYSLLDELPDRVYLTVDMDVFDPMDIPAVGTPEPGGAGWNAVSDFLFYLFKNKNVVAADIVELMPGPGDHASVRAAARLAGLIVGLRFPR